MPLYDVHVVVHYDMEVEADSYEEAEAEGWNYEEYCYNAEVYSIDVEEQPEQDDEDESVD
jgi:hypothetical protein